MFGSDALALYVDTVAAGLSAVVSAVGARRVPGSFVPSFIELPALLYYPESLAYGGTIGDDLPLTEESGQYIVRFVCAGMDSTPIRAAANALLTALTTTDASGTVTLDGQAYGVTLLAEYEWPRPLLFDDKTNTYARCLGTIFQASVMKG